MTLETNWGARQRPAPTYTTREKPYKYISKLKDADNTVCNEDGDIIYIFANEGKPIPTIWQTR